MHRTDFCIKYTQGSKEGRARCEKCDRTGKGVYYCHAGLIDFSVDLVVNGEKLGAVIGGQVLSSEPEEEKFQKVAHEIGVSEKAYIEALHKVKIRGESVINASAGLLGQVLNNYINAEYARHKNETIIQNLTAGVNGVTLLVGDIQKRTNELRTIQQKQKILALDASIEAARAGEFGNGFSVVASEVRKLSESSSKTNAEIDKILADIVNVVTTMNEQ